jgi:hypothetical protein
VKGQDPGDRGLERRNERGESIERLTEGLVQEQRELDPGADRGCGPRACLQRLGSLGIAEVESTRR